MTTTSIPSTFLGRKATNPEYLAIMEGIREELYQWRKDSLKVMDDWGAILTRNSSFGVVGEDLRSYAKYLPVPPVSHMVENAADAIVAEFQYGIADRITRRSSLESGMKQWKHMEELIKFELDLTENLLFGRVHSPCSTSPLANAVADAKGEGARLALRPLRAWSAGRSFYIAGGSFL
jgi:hypothetical protein